MAFNPETVTSWSKRCLRQGPPSTELRPEMNHFPRRTEEGSGVCRCCLHCNAEHAALERHLDTLLRNASDGGVQLVGVFRFEDVERESVGRRAVIPNRGFIA